MPSRFNPPPGWPTPPEGWQPPPDWRPDPAWPPAPEGWQFFVDDGFPTFPGHAARVRSSSAGEVSRWLGWTGLVTIALLGLLSGGVSSGLIMAGLYVLVVGLVTLARGHVKWARLGSRAAGGLAAGIGLGVLLVGGATAPPTLTASTETTAPALTADAAPTGTASAERAVPLRTPVTHKARANVTVTTRPAVVKKPKPKSVAPRKTSAPKPKPKAKPSSCYPLTNGGNCYEPGQFCRNSDHGASGLAGNGTKIVCRENNRWRWEPA